MFLILGVSVVSDVPGPLGGDNRRIGTETGVQSHIIHYTPGFPVTTKKVYSNSGNDEVVKTQKRV